MSKKVILVLPVTIAALRAYAQNDYAGISVGATIPIGSFAATNDGYDKAGYAKTEVCYGW